jgi:hypothetical protein
MTVGCWSGVGLVLAWCWSGVGLVLEWCWPGVGLVLEWCWSGVGVVLSPLFSMVVVPHITIQYIQYIQGQSDKKRFQIFQSAI